MLKDKFFIVNKSISVVYGFYSVFEPSKNLEFEDCSTI